MHSLKYLALKTIEGFNNPFKSSLKYIAFNLSICALLSIIWVVSIIVFNSAYVQFAWLGFWENLMMYKEVWFFMLFSHLYFMFYFRRSNVKALFAAIAIKSVTTVYMINLMIVCISKPLIDYSILDAEKWVEILPWKAQYPYFAVFILSFTWGGTWYSILKQREIMKKEKADYFDIYDQVISWLKK
ncbi:hypothetical protein G3479_15540 [Shewanella baltica]|uniref:hypothetical protein n=1 Tax=Shewanella baltica TaxID=62322 RepID=UPI00217EC32E|nr:hypothetical protein [Shewanella baltica]MCS6260648.1 hypothetical protein [Shewanella baltica]